MAAVGQQLLAEFKTSIQNGQTDNFICKLNETQKASVFKDYLCGSYAETFQVRIARVISWVRSSPFSDSSNIDDIAGEEISKNLKRINATAVSLKSSLKPLATKK